MRSVLVVLVLAAGVACRDPAAPTGSGSGAPALAIDATAKSGSGSGSSAPDVIVTGPAFDVPRIAPPATAVAIDPANRLVVQLDAHGALSVLRFVEPPTDRVVKGIATVEEVYPALTALIVNGPRTKPAPIHMPPDLGPRKPEPPVGTAAGRAIVAERALSVGEDAPLVLASPTGGGVVKVSYPVTFRPEP